MAKVDDLIECGTIEAIEGDDLSVVFKPSIVISKLLINEAGEMGLDIFEVGATTYGWTATIKNEAGEDIPNPVSAAEQCAAIFRGFGNQVISAAILNMAVDNARKQAEAKLAEMKGG